jgi:hypothetical protein
MNSVAYERWVDEYRQHLLATEQRCGQCQTRHLKTELTHGICTPCIETRYRPHGRFCDLHGAHFGVCLGCKEQR